MQLLRRLPRPSKFWAAPAAWIGSLTLFAAGWFTSNPVGFWLCIATGSAYPGYRVIRTVGPRLWPTCRRVFSIVWRWTKACVRLPLTILVWVVKGPVTVARKIRGERPSEKVVPAKAFGRQNLPASTQRRSFRRPRNWFVGGVLLVAVVASFFYPPVVTGTATSVAILFVGWLVIWVFKENRGQLKVFSFWHLFMSVVRWPFYAFPGVVLFALAAIPLLFVDVAVAYVINTIASTIGKAGGAVDSYLKTTPSRWDVPSYVTWSITRRFIPPTAVTDGSVFLSGVVNWITTIATLLTVMTFAAMTFAVIRFLIEIACRCLLASRGAEVSFRLDESDESAEPAAESFEASSSVREVVSIAQGTGFYSTTKLRPHGPKGQGAMPYKLTCPIARFRWGLYRLRRYRAVSNDERLTYTGGAGAHFIQVKIPDGSGLCVDLAYLVGFSDSVRLKVRWTSRLSAMLLGRIGYVIASGPGTIVLKATGPPEVLADVETTVEPNQHFDATCLIAWEPSSQFAIGASGKLLDVYLEPAFLYVQASRLTLLNPGDAQHSGIFAKLKNWFIQSVLPV